MSEMMTSNKQKTRTAPVKPLRLDGRTNISVRPARRSGVGAGGVYYSVAVVIGIPFLSLIHI